MKNIPERSMYNDPEVEEQLVSCGVTRDLCGWNGKIKGQLVGDRIVRLRGAQVIEPC